MEERYMLLEEMLQKEKQEGILESIFTILESKFPVPEDLKSQMKIEKIRRSLSHGFSLQQKPPLWKISARICN